MLAYRIVALTVGLAYFHCIASAKDSVEGFTWWMKDFESAKKNGDYAAGEKSLREALKHGRSEYAVGSLAWTQMHQGKTEEAVKTAQAMVAEFGPTTYAIGSLLETSICDGNWESMQQGLALAKQSEFPDERGWEHRMLREQMQKAEGMTRPAVYEVEWTIPKEEFASGNSRKTFGFPVLENDTQKFSFELEGARRHKVLEASRSRTVVEIHGSNRQDVIVRGRATIHPEILGRSKFRELAKLPLTKASRKETGTFYFWTEPFDPQARSISDIARSVSRPSAVETLQAILDWRYNEMPYAELKPGRESTLDRVAKQLTGVCHEASYMTASLARANGIPAVVIGVYSLPKSGSFQNIGGSHGHIRAKLPEVGWVAMEPLNRESLIHFNGSNYLQFAIQEEREERNRISLQGYPISGRRVE